MLIAELDAHNFGGLNSDFEQPTFQAYFNFFEKQLFFHLLSTFGPIADVTASLFISILSPG
jgi:hypothetical protein